MATLFDKISQNTFFRNYSLLAIGNFSSRVVSMFTNIIVARWLSPSLYGEYTLVLTYISLFYFVASLGLSQLTIRYVARNQDNSAYYFRLSTVLRIVGFLISTIVFFIYIHFASESFTQFIIFSILGGIFLESIWEGLQNIAFGMQKMEWNAIISVVSAFFNLIIYILLPRALFTVNIVLGIYIGIYILKNIAYYFSLKKFHLLKEKTKKHLDVHSCVIYLKESIPFYILFLLGLFTTQLPVIFLSYNSTIYEVAYFNTANKLLLPLTLFMNTAFTAFFPNQSILYDKNKHAFCRQTKKVLLIVTLCGCTSAFIVSLFKHELTSIMYGDAYRNTANVLALQCWYIVMYSIFCFNGNTLAAANAQNKLAICSIVYALISTPILYYFSKNGANGLSLGFVIASIINLMYILPILKGVIKNNFSWLFIILLLSLIFGFMVVSMFISDKINLVYRITFFIFTIMWIFIYRSRIYAYIKKGAY